VTLNEDGRRGAATPRETLILLAQTDFKTASGCRRADRTMLDDASHPTPLMFGGSRPDRALGHCAGKGAQRR